MNTVLVIDDEASIRRFLSVALTRAGYVPLPASSREDGLRLFQEQADLINAVLLDVHMVGASVKEMIAELQGIRADAHIIVISGSSSDDLPNQLPLGEHVRFLKKPFRVEDLLEQM